MSYLPATMRRSARFPLQTRRPGALGDLFDDIRQMAGADAQFAAMAQKCDPVAQAASAQLDNQLQAMISGWKQRDDFYYVGDMQKVLQAGLDMIKFGQTQLDAIDNKSFTSVAQPNLFKVGGSSIDYINAMNQAIQTQATVVDAPGFKDWVIDAWNAASLCVYALALAECAKPPIVSAVQAMVAISNVFVAAVKATAAVALKAGEVVYHATTGALGLAATLVKYGPLIALGLGGVLLVKHLQRR